MTPELERILARAFESESLSDAERARMRSELAAYASYHGVRALPKRSAAQGWLAHFRRPLPAALGILVAVLAATGGIAYAAEGALPGNPLYGVKVGVVEPVQGAFAVSTEAQAAWQMTLAERRLFEAATLAAHNELSTTTANALAMRFSMHAANASSLIARESTRDPVAGRIASTRFSARLSGYAVVFSTLDAPAAATTTNALAVATERANAPAPKVMALMFAPAARPAGNDAESSSTATGDRTLAAGLEDAANAALMRSAAIIDALKGTLGTTTSAAAEERLATARAQAQEGHALLARNDAGGATLAFTDTLSQTSELDVLAHAATTLHVNPFAARGTRMLMTGATGEATGTSEEGAPARFAAPPMAAPMHGARATRTAATSSATTTEEQDTASTTIRLEGSVRVDPHPFW